jgi:hypothetical protein
MERVLDFIDLDQFLPLVLLIALFWFVGRLMTPPDSPRYRLARSVAAAAFITYAILATAVWSPSSPREFLTIAFRALLAGGLVLGLTLVALPAVFFVYQHSISRFAERSRAWAARQRQWLQEQIARRKAAAQTRCEQEARRLQAITAERERQRAIQEAEAAQRDRKLKSQDAQEEVLRFFSDHEALIQDAMPRALLRAQLKSRFPENIAQEHAWQQAQEMITAMLALVAQGRERQRNEIERERQRADRARRLGLEITRLEQEITRLRGSSVADADLTGDEINALREQIRLLQEEKQTLTPTPPDQQLSPPPTATLAP